MRCDACGHQLEERRLHPVVRCINRACAEYPLGWFRYWNRETWSPPKGRPFDRRELRRQWR